jgi:hypothetical protein
MLQSYFPIYQIALDLQDLRARSELFLGIHAPKISDQDVRRFRALLGEMQRICLEYGLTHTAELVECVINRPAPETHADIISKLTHLNDSLSNQLKKEAVFRVPPELKEYYEQDDFFGPDVGEAFPSCGWDIQRAATCYALEQGDACVHHLMLVLERGLNALAVKVDVPYQRTNWQNIIEAIASKLKSAPKGSARDFYIEVNSQFGLLKDTYRNHSEHARDDHYDMPKALHILNHVRDFMQAIAKGGLAE